MGGGTAPQDAQARAERTLRPLPHLLASGVAALVNYPLWKISAIRQSGFRLPTDPQQQPQQPQQQKGARGGSGGMRAMLGEYMYALKPPHRAVLAVAGGMTWARAFIFYASEGGRRWMLEHMQVGNALSTAIPPLLASTFVQIVNAPLIRSSITLQDPSCTLSNVPESIAFIYRNKGLGGLFHGLSAGIGKTVPKYVTAVCVKQVLEDHVLPPSSSFPGGKIVRSATKSIVAAVAGAVLTNPFDVLRNEMFKTDASLPATFRALVQKEGTAWIGRGLRQNLVAVSFPIAVTVFLTDVFSWRMYPDQRP